MSPGRRCSKKHPGKAPRPSVEAAIENLNASVSQPPNRSRDVIRLPPEPDVVSSNSTNSVREQLRQVNQRIDEVQRDFVGVQGGGRRDHQRRIPICPRDSGQTNSLQFPTTGSGALQREH
ncbi:hypothetical protein B296_00041596 [Ensete ventricosum]|uniref:Uncharacterized protein n=1 Tax=Ensete ventricosum TaxID=4639 RepID=A0A426XLJ6_ENSVE|nr:hypothetical protein B296_00041596 [Ensete ventricosum]